MVKKEVRCPICNRKLMEIYGQATTKCPKCKSVVEIKVIKDNIQISIRD